MTCVSVRKKGSTEPCITPALRGHSLCGRHARMKSPLLWTDAVDAQSSPLIQAQALVRGWLLRKRLRLAGPGVLSRKNLTNDEELVTCEPKEREHPMTYFAFEENGKVWWFSFGTLWTWARQSHEPVNPYTKVPLSQDTRRRLRTLWRYTQNQYAVAPEENSDPTQRLRCRWNVVVQTFLDNGFVDVHPQSFTPLSPNELHAMFVFLERDIDSIVSKNDPFRPRALRICRRGIEASTRVNDTLYKLWSVYALTLLLTLHKDPYNMTFMVLSALYRC